MDSFVICIKNDGISIPSGETYNYSNLTIGNVYTVITTVKYLNWDGVSQYHIIDDSGNIAYMNGELFITLKEHRQNVINNILNEPDNSK